MKNEKNNNRLKVLFILSLICNLAFIGGFIIKKTLFSSGKTDEDYSFPIVPDEREGKHFEGREKHEILDLCKRNPLFKKLFNEHCKANFDTMMQIHSLRYEILEKIKKGITDLKEFEETISKLEILNTDSERENIRHFIELKKILGDEKFEQLTQRMKKKIAMQTHRMNKFYKCANQEKTKPNTK
jgi:hypothetical protein